MNKLFTPIILMLAVIGAGCGGDNGGTNPPPPPTPAPRLVVDTTVTAPLMNDVNEAVWGQVDSVLIEIGGDPANYGFNSNLGKQNVTMKAIKKNDTLYVRARWKDASAHLRANRLRRLTTPIETWEFGDLVGQDMFFVIFDGGNNGTEKADCATMCHTSGMATTGGGNADAWKWMSTSTFPGKMAEDQWIGAAGTNSDAVINKYVYRNNHDAGQPFWVHEDTSAYTGVFLYLDDTVKYDPIDNDYWPENFIVPGFVIDSTIYAAADRNNNSLNNVRAIARFDSSGVNTNWTWTLVMARALNTGKVDDVNLLPLDSVQITIAATNNHFQSNAATKPEHSGSKPFYLILKP